MKARTDYITTAAGVDPAERRATLERMAGKRSAPTVVPSFVVKTAAPAMTVREEAMARLFGLTEEQFIESRKELQARRGGTPR